MSGIGPNRCLTSQSLRTRKRFETSVPTAVAAELHVLLRKNRGWPPMDLPLQPPTQFRQKGRFGLDPPIEVAPGPYAVTKPALMPVRVRQRHDRLYNGYRAWIEVGRWPPTYRHLPSGLTAPSEEVRQRRRLTWLEAFNTYALPEHAEVRLSVEYPSARTVRPGKGGDPAARGRNMDSRRRA